MDSRRGSSTPTLQDVEYDNRPDSSEIETDVASDMGDDDKTAMLAPQIRRLFNTSSDEADCLRFATEYSPLLKNPDCNGRSYGDAPAEIEASRTLGTSWRHETKVIAVYSVPMTITLLLQYSVDMLGVFAAGRIGTAELAAISLANLSAALTCFAPFQGMATCLDTLCAQAYGSGQRHLVGIYCQRMTAFLSCFALPISIFWVFSEPFILPLTPDAETAKFVATYLGVLAFAIPGFIVFECGKRFLQAQGLFQATTYILIFATPVHALIIWLLVWRLGFVGIPIAVAITRTLLATGLILYVRLFRGMGCWGGLSVKMFSNWWMMIRLAVPGMIMMLVEWLAFDLMTIFSSRFGTDYLAAQSILVSVSTIAFEVPFSISIAASTRIARLVGARRLQDGKAAAAVAFIVMSAVGICSLVIIVALQDVLPYFFTDDPSVIALASAVLPFVGIMTFFNGHSLVAHGLLRGIGKQSIGTPANIFAYYIVGLPVAAVLAFKFEMELTGLYLGFTVGGLVVSVIEYGFLHITSWQVAAKEAADRGAAG
ncbi:hypothetical protein NLG97_g2251 [Lecanicillium saksenae]|uniref:Uncharacterized protein n=1 Tax=Lecanicillium saksenae TaxID=468837 RepID=A0ACC1R3A6_9HYPO|nr:hypothetical protein NLG97_g2251 [Lecanicillium saksenae]